MDDGLGDPWQGSMGSMDMDDIYLQMSNSPELEVAGALGWAAWKSEQRVRS